MQFQNIKEMIKEQLKHYVPFIIIGILLILLCFKQCNVTQPIQHNNEPIKKDIKALEVKKAAEQFKANKTDTIRLKGIDRWHKAKTDTLYLPCKDIIALADTIILIDSTEISQLRQINLFNDSIITDQKILLYNDSLDILALKKYCKQQKRQKNIALLGLGVLGGILLVK